MSEVRKKMLRMSKESTEGNKKYSNVLGMLFDCAGALSWSF